MATEVDEIGGDVMCTTEVDENGGDVVMWPPKLRRLKGVL